MSRRKVIIVVQTAFAFWHAAAAGNSNWGQNKRFPHSGVGP
jgi:hypothetical protein